MPQSSSPKSQTPSSEPAVVVDLPPQPPVLRRRRTWLVFAAFGMLALAASAMPLGAGAAMDGLHPAQVRIGLGIFLCIAFLWMSEALPLPVTALMVPLFAILLRVSDVKASLVSFSNPLILVFFGGFALASALSYQGLDRWIAQSLVRLGRGKFIPVSCLLFCCAAFLSMWMSNTATVAMMLPLALGILRHIKSCPQIEHNRTFLLLGLAYSASIGGLGTIIGSPPNGIAATQLGTTFTEWLKFGIPTVLVLMPILILVVLWIFRPTRGLRIELKAERFAFNPQRRTTLAIFISAAVCWVAGEFLGPLLGIHKSFDTVVALAAFFALIFFQVLPWREVSRRTDWGVLILFGGGIALSGVLRDTGASLYLARLLSGATGNWPLIAITAALVCFVIFLTELSSNTAMAALFVPIFFSVAGEMQIMPDKLVIPLALAASCAFMMPVATPPNAIVFGTGLVRQSSMMKAGLLLNLIFTVLITALAWVLL
jgi:sodium-dependent dicarboxylate transporter 2/3/5